LREEKLNLLIAKLAKLGAENIVDANVVRISSVVELMVSYSVYCGEREKT
jgi:hypothetical protein